MKNIIDDDYLKNNILHPTNYLPLNEIFVGPECENLLETLQPQKKKQIILNTLAFYVSMCEEILNRLPIGDTLFAEIAYFAPSIVLEVDKRNHNLQRICALNGETYPSNLMR
jgi:hypothetical protein